MHLNFGAHCAKFTYIKNMVVFLILHLGHSMMDTLAVALRVAEEAVEEAISKAETYSDSLVTLSNKMF